MKDKRIKLFYTDKSAELCGRIILKVYRYENYGRKAGRADVCRHTQQRRFQGVLRGRGQQGGGDVILLALENGPRLTIEEPMSSVISSDVVALFGLLFLCQQVF